MTDQNTEAAELLEALLRYFTVMPDGCLERSFIEDMPVREILGEDVEKRLVAYIDKHGLPCNLS